MSNLMKTMFWPYLFFLTKSFSLASEWNDWIIIPARSENRLHELRNSSNSSVFGVSSVEHFDQDRSSRPMETFIMRTFKAKNIQNLLNQEPKNNIRMENGGIELNSDLVIPIGRALDKIRAVCGMVMDFFDEYFFHDNRNNEYQKESSRNLKKIKKRYRKLLFPLLLAYKLKFLALIPLLMGGLVLLVGTTGMAGFFFALFTAVMALRSEHKVEVKKW